MKTKCPIYNNPNFECEEFRENTSCMCSQVYNAVYNIKGEIIYFSCPKYKLGLQIKETLDSNIVF